MLVGLPARGAAAMPGSGPGRKNARHCGESCDFFWIMQAGMAATVGTKSPDSRIASGVQACWSSWGEAKPSPGWIRTARAIPEIAAAKVFLKRNGGIDPPKYRVGANSG